MFLSWCSFFFIYFCFVSAHELDLRDPRPQTQSSPFSCTNRYYAFTIPRAVQANSILGKKLDLPALGVNLPSAETLENILPKGGDGGGISGLKDTVQGARKKARDLLLKTKDKIESNENDKKEFEENANGDADEHSPTAEDDGSSPPSSSSSTSSSSLRMPYFESTYCDEDLRVGRTGQGDVFVSVRA